MSIKNIRLNPAAALIFLVIAMVGSAGCRGKDAEAKDARKASDAVRMFTDGVGRDVEIPVNPQRIVVLHDSNGPAQILSLGVKPVGMATRDGVFHLADQYDLSGVEGIGDYGLMSMETILALEPDLIIGYTFGGQLFYEPSEIESYESIAPFVIMETATSVEDVMAGFGDLLDEQAEVEAQRNRYLRRIAQVRSHLPENLDDIRISVISMAPDNQIYTFGRGWFSSGEVFEDIGFSSYPDNQSSGAAVEQGWLPYVSIEAFSDFDGDVVFYDPWGNDYSDHPLFLGLKAVQAGQAFEWDEDWWGSSYDGLSIILDDLERWFTEIEIDPDVYPNES